MLRHAEGAWALAVFEHEGVQRRVMGQLRDDLAPIPLVEVSFLDHGPDPLEILRSAEISALRPPPVVAFTAVQRALPDLCGYLDLQREILARMPFRLLFWVTETERSALREAAPNFYSRLSSVFRFEGGLGAPLEKGSVSIQPDDQLVHSPLSRYRPLVPIPQERDREERIALHRKRLEELASQERVEHEVLADSWYDLAGLLESGRRSQWSEAEAAYSIASREYGKAQIHRAQGDASLRAGYAAGRRYAHRRAQEHFAQAREIFLRQRKSSAPGDDREAAAGEATVAVALGDLYVRTDRLRDGEEAYQQALSIYRDIEDRLGEANTRKALGDLYVRTDRLREGEEAYQQALPIYHDIEHRLGEANTRKAFGDLYVRTSRLREGEEAYQQALPIYRDIEDRLGEANTRKAFGDLYVRTSRLREGEEAYQQALPIYRDIEDRLGETNTRKALGDLYVRTSRLREGEVAYQQALPIYQDIEDRLGEANTRKALGDLYVRTSRLREGEEAYQQALPIYQDIESRLGKANTLLALGDLYVRTSRLREGKEAYQQALPTYRDIEDRLGEAKALRALGNLELTRGEPTAAFVRWLEVLEIQRAIENRLGEAGTHIYMARSAASLGEYHHAVALGGKAWEMSRETGSLLNQVLALDDLLTCFRELQDSRGLTIALLLSRWLGRKIEHPSVALWERELTGILEDFDSQDTLSEEMQGQLTEDLAGILRSYTEELKERGEDPYRLPSGEPPTADAISRVTG